MVAVGALSLAACSHGDTSKLDKDDGQSSMEILRRVWNGMTAQQQRDICNGVEAFGADSAADQVQAAAGNSSADFHDDVVFFLEDVACN